MDGLNAAAVGEAVARARPDVIVHQMTAIAVGHAGKADMKHMDRWFTGTNRLRSEGTDHRPRFEADQRERDELAERFFDAFREGDVDRLTALLAADVQMVADSGGKAPMWGRGIIAGAGNVARIIASLIGPFARTGGIVEPHQVNGQPGAILRDRAGRIVNVLMLDILDGQVQAIHTVLNPDKLSHVGPVADGWAVLRETTSRRRAEGAGGSEPGVGGLV